MVDSETNDIEDLVDSPGEAAIEDVPPLATRGRGRSSGRGPGRPKGSRKGTSVPRSASGVAKQPSKQTYFQKPQSRDNVSILIGHTAPVSSAAPAVGRGTSVPADTGRKHDWVHAH